MCMFSACDATKNIPQGQYLVSKVSLDVDTKDVNKGELSSYIRQQPNDPIVVDIYNWSYGSNSWFKKLIGKLGKAPVIYDERSRIKSENDIRTEMHNHGYLNAEVTSSIDTLKKKASIHYNVVSHDPYKIRNFKIDIDNARIQRILDGTSENRSRRRRLPSELKEGAVFDLYNLQNNVSRISDFLGNRGYYTTTADNFHYLADTTVQNNQVDLTLILKDSVKLVPFRIRNVSVYSGYDPLNRRQFRVQDSIINDDVKIYYDSKHFIRSNVLRRNIIVKPGQYYSSMRSERTYNNFTELNCISRTSIKYEEVADADSAMLDCNIYLTPGNIHGIQAGLDGTNKAGDFGVAANVAYTHHNIFNGSEVFGVKLRGAYEFVSGSQSDLLTHNFYEFGIGFTLGFPQTKLTPMHLLFNKQDYKVTSEFGVSFDIQRRPEYTREFFNFNWKNKWNNMSRTISQSLTILDVNYVMMPWMSDDFRNYINQEDNSLTKYSYENVFTAGIGYNIIYTNNMSGRFGQRLHTIRGGIETSGNLLDAAFRWAKANKSDEGQYNILGNPFAQYVKGDIDYAQTRQISAKGTIAFHVGLGAAYPYGNSTVMPFEKRYYAGGPNSVRGWSTRYLGPGSYNQDVNNPSTHVGDLNFITSFEYRHKWIKWLELAAYVDAGNVWTLREYDNQPGGMFEFSDFYKEIALGTGIGVRLDLGFLIVRLDTGKKVYDPAKEEGKRWVLFDKFGGNSAFYLAIGYPF